MRSRAEAFLGLHEFQAEPLFDPSMMTHFRKRFTADDIAKINEELYRRTHTPKDKPPHDSGNSGTPALDATAAPADAVSAVQSDCADASFKKRSLSVGPNYKHSVSALSAGYISFSAIPAKQSLISSLLSVFASAIPAFRAAL